MSPLKRRYVAASAEKKKRKKNTKEKACGKEVGNTGRNFRDLCAGTERAGDSRAVH